MRWKIVGMMVVTLTASAALWGFASFESSNGWGLPGSTGKITVVYGTVDDWTAAFQMMLCFDPNVIEVDTCVIFGEGGVSTVFDTAWGGTGPSNIVTYWDNDQGFFQIAVLYDIVPPLDQILGPMNRAPLFIIKWNVKSDAAMPSLVVMLPSEDCGSIHSSCVFSDTTGSSIHPDTMISGTYYVVPPGDANADGAVTYTDLANIANFLYGGGDIVPSPAADVNMTCTLDYIDMVYLAGYLFMGQAAPLSPICPWKKWDVPGLKEVKIPQNWGKAIGIDGNSQDGVKGGK